MCESETRREGQQEGQRRGADRENTKNQYYTCSRFRNIEPSDRTYRTYWLTKLIEMLVGE